ncbi:MAG: radical SAM protein [Planctomycetaceae bacterium]|nr:radical SAM protein [Planctomycetaceae bacterium]
MASTIRRSNVANVIRHVIHKRHIYVNTEGKIVFPLVNIFIVKGCNLKCEHCVSFNPFRHGMIPKEEVINTIRQWSERISPQTIALLGGEPLLHPDYQAIAIAARNTWKQSVVTIITNGLLLPKVQDDFLKRMVDHDIEFVVSRHINTENYNRSLSETIRRFQKFGVKYEMIESQKSWVTCHSLNTDGVPISPNSNPTKSWTHCLSKTCTTINNNQLYYCSVIFNMLQAVNEGSLPLVEFSGIAKHRFVTLDDSNKTILKYLRNSIPRECRFCLENFENIEAKQIPTEELKHIKLMITKMNNEFNTSGSNLI